ncbi:beta-class carbonic anhydrase [Psychrobacillus lasiicapitis]|uniref:carbonic anhydrase n=1 Tax=Psychrobacillus lasiicapitis TaxID=1636719 RepID=A0A544TCD7_9BACI|nr:carbonic anhydrase [Psychrobacillus lasiicapitis]TQR15132.1 carbonic anhydrase [Psychrobacillus lasiicapitis]GGA22733.1 putative carbonic anhydrase YvdA [Psychrobacillus lasiicapitis]
MTLISEILEYNNKFVEDKEYEKYETTKFPNKKMVILTCMDTRLVELLPKAMNIKNGDIKLIKNAGAIVSHPFGSVMRSILVAVYELGAKEVAIVGHHGCGMNGLEPNSFLEKCKEGGLDETVLPTLMNAGIDVKSWLTGFQSVEESVEQSVNMVKNHPMFPKHISVHGLVICPETGKLDVVVDGYER